MLGRRNQRIGKIGKIGTRVGHKFLAYFNSKIRISNGMKLNNKIKFLSVFAFTFLALAVFAIPAKVLAAAPTISVAPATIKVGEKAIFTVTNASPDSNGTFFADSGSKEESFSFTTDSSGNVVSKGQVEHLSFDAVAADVGDWEGYVTINSQISSNTVHWTVLAADSGVSSGPPTLSISPSSIKLGETARFSAANVPANQSGTLHTSKNGVAQPDESFTTDNSGRINVSISFHADPGDEGSWTASIETPATGSSNTVSWTVLAQDSGGGNSGLLGYGETCNGTSEICESHYCGPDNTCQEDCASNATWNSVGKACVPNGGTGAGGGSNSGPCDNPAFVRNSVGVCIYPSPAGPVGTSAQCNNDPKLIYQNGVCLPADQNCTTGICASSSLTDLLVKVIKILLGLAGVIAVLILIVGGFWYITSSGNEEQVEKGKKAIINAIIGLVVVMLSYAIVTIISTTLTKPRLL